MFVRYAENNLDIFAVEMKSKLFALKYGFMISTNDMNDFMMRAIHWEIDYRKIIGIYRNFDGELLHSYFTTVS
jgi:hypothetical protein